jgi:hypothetical protein
MRRRVPWILVIGLCCGSLSWLGVRAMASGWRLPPCLFKAVTGLPCATCGGTRCVLALGAGQWSEAFHWHPILVIFVMGFPLLALWDARRAVLNRPYPSLPDSDGWRWAVAGLLVGTWALQILRGI